MQEDIQLWEESAQAWVAAQADKGDSSRQFLDPILLSRLGDVRGLRTLDIGCGEGRFSRVLRRLGAETVGLEPTGPLLRHAAQDGGLYAGASGTSLPIRSGTFDLAVLYLVLIDIEAFEVAIQEAARVLKPGGRLAVVNITSMSTASTSENMWIRDANRKKLGRFVEQYSIPRSQIEAWNGIRIRNYHRPLEMYMRAYLEAGFILRSFDEPTGEGMDHVSEDWIADCQICPLFNIMVWEKGIAYHPASRR
jgi:SAM-dependent methyltransferase